MKSHEPNRIIKWFFVAVVVLTAGLFTVLISGLLGKKGAMEMMQEEGNLTLTVAQVADLIHAIQLERGLSIAFLYSRNL